VLHFIMSNHLHGVSIRYGANLPHWTMEGAIYSVTFRLEDSVPAERLEAWKNERARLRQRAIHGELTEFELKREESLYSQRIEEFLDAGCGSCVLRDPRVAEIVANAIKFFKGKRYELFAWCVMPNHAHVVLKPVSPHVLSNIMHSWKSFTSKEINRLLGTTGTLWQGESFDRLIRDGEELQRAIAYVANNPDAAGLVKWPWVWSV
jgi:REP element-mobilizing transposase RayT